LREFFNKRGVAIGAGGLAAVIAGNAVEAAPAGLAAVISTAALAGASLSATATAAATKVIAMTTLQKTLAGAILAALTGVGFYQVHQISKLWQENRLLRQQQAPLVEQIQSLERERDQATNQLVSRTAERAQTPSDGTEVLKLRAEVTRLRGQLRELQDSQPKQNNTAATERVPRESWSLAGNATPEATLQTFLSATRDLDTNSLLAVFPPQLKQLEEKRHGMTDLMVNALALKYKAFADFQILSKTQVSPDEVFLSVRYGKGEGSATNSEVESFRMKQFQDGWKILEQMGD
jgi:hypothetical protein